MLPVIAILGLMAFTWAIAMYATNLEEPQQESQRAEKSGKAA
jgi:hypothetical protein